VFVASNYGPYSNLGDKAVLVDENTEKAWYNALKRVVDDKVLRRDTLKNAQDDLFKNWRLEDQWKSYKRMFETVMEKKNENNPTIKE
jgi:hypothetical protein